MGNVHGKKPNIRCTFSLHYAFSICAVIILNTEDYNDHPINSNFSATLREYQGLFELTLFDNIRLTEPWSHHDQIPS